MPLVPAVRGEKQVLAFVLDVVTRRARRQKAKNEACENGDESELHLDGGRCLAVGCLVGGTQRV